VNFGIRRWPIIPSLVVVAAAAVMVMLGFWQLQRLEQKEAMLADYAAAQAMSSEARYPSADPAEIEAALYRRARFDCRSTSGEWQSIAGRNRQDQTGYVHIILCQMEDGRPAWVQAGWTPGPTPPDWRGGEVSGIIVPFNGGGGARLIADPPIGGIAASAIPDPAELPNNHLAYAVQWFIFALTALVIYVLALRSKQRGG
jgi:surfeit locus 1 family protein